MRKKFKWLLALVAMVASVNLMAGVTDLSESLDLTGKTAGSGAYNTTTTYGDWKIVNGANNNKGWTYFKMGGKDKTISSYNPCYIYYAAASGVSSQVDSITVSIAAGSLKESKMSVNSWGVYVYSDKAMNTQIDFVAGGTITKNAAKFGFKPSAGKTWAAGSYYKVSWDLANTTSTNGIVCVDKITLHSISAAPSVPVDPTVTFSDGEVKATKTLDLSTLYSSNSSGVVTYAITEGDAATINGTILTGVTAGGSVKVTASQAAATGYNANETTATITITAAPVETTFSLVTDASKLEEGQNIIIVNKNATVALGHQSGNNCPETAVTCTDNKISVEEGSDVQVIALGKAQKDSKDYWTFSVGENKYLYAASSDNNHLKIQDPLDNNGKWSIAINATSNEATIEAQGSNSHNSLRYNSGSKIFSCYSTGQAAVKIFAEVVNSEITLADCTNGSVSVTGADDLTSVASGTAITLGNTPADGYTLDAYDVYKTGESATKVTIEDGKFKMPAYPVTVSATFKVAKVLNSVEITTPATKTEFWKGEEFSAEGLVLTAHFANGDEVVTPTSITEPDMSTAGVKTITVSFTEGATTKTDEYDITVKSIANTKETAYTVAQAIELYNAGFDLEATVYVKGVITNITGTNKNNIYIKDAEQSNSFEFFGLVDGDATVSSLTQYDTIIGHGQLDKYNSTFEFKFGCVLDERKAYVAPAVVTDPSNTPETAYTPAEAIAIYDDGANYDLTKAVYVKGVVTTKPSMTTSGDWKGSYYQVKVAAAETTEPTFVFFHMFAGAESAKFTSDIINVKDTVIAYGTLTKYISTYELAERCYMIEHKPYQVPVTGVTIDNKEGLTVPANESITLTATIADEGAVGTLVWSVIAGDTYASVDQTGKVTGLAAGDATIQVQVQGTEFTDQCTITVTAAYEGASLPYNFDDNSQSTNPAFSHNGCGDYSSSPKLKFDGTGDYAIFHIAEAPAYMSFDIKGNGSPWAGQFDVLESADNETYTSVASYTELESSTTSLNVLLTGTSRYIKFVYTTKSSGNVALGNIKILATAPKVDPEFTIANVDVVVEDMAALQITTNSDGAVTYTIDPNNSGIEIIEGVVYAHAAGTYTVTADKAETALYNAAQTTFTVSVSSVEYKTAEVSTFSAVDGGLLELGQFHSHQGGSSTAPGVYDNQIRLYQNGGYITISALPGLKIAKIDITTAMATSYNYKVDAAEDYTLTEAAALANGATANLAGLNADSVRIYCLGTNKNSRFYVSYLKVYYTGELETVSALAVAGAEVTEYEIGETVDHAGAVVTATFATAGDVDVTLNSTFTDPDMGTSGTKQVTANFAEQTATYDITIAAETPEITVEATSVAFGMVAKDAVKEAKIVAVTLKAITEATVAVTGEGAGAFNVTPASMTESGNITITPVTTAAGEFTATITISAEGAESKEIALSMTVAVATSYTLVTDASILKAGDTIVMAATYNNKTYVNGGLFGDLLTCIEATAGEGTISAAGACEFVLGGEAGAWTLTSTEGNLGATAAKKLTYDDTKTNFVGTWSISINDANATIAPNGDSYGRFMYNHNNGNNRFLTYTSNVSATMLLPQIYYKPAPDFTRDGLVEKQLITVCLDKNITGVEGGTFFEIDNGNASEITFAEITTFPIEKATPLLFESNGSEMKVFCGSDKIEDGNEDIIVEHRAMKGLVQTATTAPQSIEEGNILVSGGKLRLVGTDCYLTAGHAYIDAEELATLAPLSQQAGVARRRLVLKAEESHVVTGLDALMLNGNAPRKVMHHNQIVIIREGKMYTAQGQLMK